MIDNPPTAALKVHLKNRDAIYKAYLSFINHGGVFIPTNKSFDLDQSVYLELSLLDELKPYKIYGKICWITPDSSDSRIAGIGVQFDEEEGLQARGKIEALLAGMLASEQPTNTI